MICPDWLFPHCSSAKFWEFPDLRFGPSASLVGCHFPGWASPWLHRPCVAVPPGMFRKHLMCLLNLFSVTPSWMHVSNEVLTDTPSLVFTGSSLSHPTCNKRVSSLHTTTVPMLLSIQTINYFWTRQQIRKRFCSSSLTPHESILSSTSFWVCKLFSSFRLNWTICSSQHN